MHPFLLDLKGTHLNDLPLADLDLRRPGMLLGIDVLVKVLRQGRQIGPLSSPSAFETEFGWVLDGRTCSTLLCHVVTTYHITMVTGDDILRNSGR